MTDPLCANCNHPRSEHSEEQPYECMNGDMCDCESFSYVKKERVAEIEARSPKKPGAVCAKCGRTVTEAEYSSGEPVCCGDFVIAEEDYK